MRCQHHLEQGKHCLYATLHNLFLEYGIPLREYELYFLCNGLFFQFDLKANQDSFLNFIRFDYKLQLEHLAEILHFDFQYWNRESLNTSLQTFRSVLAERLPTILFLESTALQYHILQNPRRNLGAHCLALWEIEPESQSVLAGDSYVLDKEGRVGTHVCKLAFHELADHLIGAGTFQFNHILLPELRERIKMDAEKIAQFASDCPDRGTGAILQIIDSMGSMGRLSDEKSFEKMVEFIFLFKAYFSSTLGYLQDLLTDERIGAADSGLLDSLAGLKNQWQNFYIRCLTVTAGNSASVLKKIQESGREMLFQQRRVFREIAADLNNRAEYFQ